MNVCLYARSLCSSTIILERIIDNSAGAAAAAAAALLSRQHPSVGDECMGDIIS